MGAVETRKLTYEELRAMPQDGKRYELLEGEVYMAPSPNVKHQRVIRNLLIELESYVKKKGLGEVFVVPLDVVLDDHNVVQPDIFFVSQARAHAITPLFVNGAPDLVVEVLSPGNADFDRGAKRRAYAAAGVPEIWYADPRDDSVEVLRLGPDRAYAVVRRFSGDEILVSESLPGFELSLRKLFA